MRCPPIDILVGFVYIEGAGVTPRPSVCYQFSNLRIAAVIRPEIVPARMSASKSTFLEGRAVGFRLRRFFLPISTTPFLIIIIYLREITNGGKMPSRRRSHGTEKRNSRNEGEKQI